MAALRAWRLEEARHQESPPYVIFHDATLIEVARRRPTTLAALSTIPGIGRSKLERYGEAVLAVIAGDRRADERSVIRQYRGGGVAECSLLCRPAIFGERSENSARRCTITTETRHSKS